MTPRRTLSTLAVLLILPLISPAEARAHCDHMDGPVVVAAQKALETRNVNHVLMWVAPGDEAEIREAFDRTLAARETGPVAREVADRWFFETLVRVHRESEGAPYTGLKPAGTPVSPAIEAADRSVQTGSLEEVEGMLMHAIRDGLRARFQALRSRQDFGPDEVQRGREWVHEYVPYIHYVKGIYDAAVDGPGGHGATEGERPAGDVH